MHKRDREKTIKFFLTKKQIRYHLENIKRIVFALEDFFSPYDFPYDYVKAGLKECLVSYKSPRPHSVLFRRTLSNGSEFRIYIENGKIEHGRGWGECSHCGLKSKRMSPPVVEPLSPKAGQMILVYDGILKDGVTTITATIQGFRNDERLCVVREYSGHEYCISFDMAERGRKAFLKKEKEKEKKTSYYLSVFNKKGERECFYVQQEVYLYVKQLEGYIKNPESSSLKNIYWGRFGN